MVLRRISRDAWPNRPTHCGRSVSRWRISQNWGGVETHGINRSKDKQKSEQSRRSAGFKTSARVGGTAGARILIHTPPLPSLEIIFPASEEVQKT